MAFGHGKVILLGEHSVVHGRPALAVAVPRGAEITVVPAAPKLPATTLHIEPWNVSVDAGPAPNLGREPLQEALRVACGFYDDGRHFALSATVRLPSGAGMGSSAALGVAVLRALDDARGLTRSDDEIYQRSLAWEGVFHGNPSGVDNAMATHGGVGLFTRGSPLTPVVPRHPVRLVAAYSGASSDTKGMVESVARQFERNPEQVGRQFDAIGAIVMNGKLALEQGELRSLGQLMTMNHKLLAGLMLSTAALEEMITAAMEAGALGAKVTGAGGGGCMIALVDSVAQQQAVGDALRKLDKTVYDVESGS